MTRIKTNEPIRQLMNKCPVTLTPETKISEAARLFKEWQIRHLPVVSGGKLIGMFSQTDLLQMDYSKPLAQDKREVYAHLDATLTIGDLMTKSLVTASESDSIRDCAAMMCNGHFHALPIVDKSGVIIGIVTSTDLLRYLAEL